MRGIIATIRLSSRYARRYVYALLRYACPEIGLMRCITSISPVHPAQPFQHM
jgi:hypothetical protein